MDTSIAFEHSLRSAAKELPPSLLEAPGVCGACCLRAESGEEGGDKTYTQSTIGVWGDLFVLAHGVCLYTDGIRTSEQQGEIVFSCWFISPVGNM